jgi:hypothetical protein
MAIVWLSAQQARTVGREPSSPPTLKIQVEFSGADPTYRLSSLQHGPNRQAPAIDNLVCALGLRLAGGVGIAPSLNAGGEHAMAQAVHGTAPDIAGKGIANPSALILSTALLLNWFYQRTRIEACRETARLLDRGVRDAIASGAATQDLGGEASTDAFATAVIAALEAA